MPQPDDAIVETGLEPEPQPNGCKVAKPETKSTDIEKMNSPTALDSNQNEVDKTGNITEPVESVENEQQIPEIESSSVIDTSENEMPTEVNSETSQGQPADTTQVTDIEILELHSALEMDKSHLECLNTESIQMSNNFEPQVNDPSVSYGYGSYEYYEMRQAKRKSASDLVREQQMLMQRLYDMKLKMRREERELNMLKQQCELAQYGVADFDTEFY